MAGKSKYSLEALLALRDGLTAPLRGVVRGVADFSKTMRAQFADLNGPIKAMNKSIDRGLKAAGAGLVAFAAVGVKSSIELADALAKVSTIATTTTPGLEEMKRQMVGVSNETGKAVREIAEATYEAISAGVATAHAVTFVEVATKAAVAGFTETAVAVDALTTVLNAYGLQASEARRISDQLLVTQNLGKTTVGELGQYLGQVVPIAASLNVATEELFGSLAALTMQGIKSQAAVTGMKAAFSNIIKPSESAAKMAAKLGIQFGAAALREKGLARFLGEVAQAAKGDTAILAELFGSVEALNAVTVLTGKGAKAFTEAIDAMNTSVGATEDAFSKVMGTPGKRMLLALNRLRNVALRLGDKLAPAIEAVAGHIERLAGGLDRLDFSAITGLMKAGLGLFKLVLKLWPVLLGLAVAIKVVTIATGVFNVTLAAGPIGWIILAITALTVAIVLLVKHWRTITEAVKAAWGWFNRLYESSAALRQALFFLFQPLWLIVGVIRTIIDLIRGKGAAAFQNLIPPWLAAAISGVTALVKSLQRAFENFASFVAAAWNGVRDTIMAVIDAILAGVDRVRAIGGRVAGLFGFGEGEKSAGAAAGPHGYSHPGTRTAESRSYHREEIRHNVQIVAPRAYALRESGGVPKTELNYGINP